VLRWRRSTGRWSNLCDWWKACSRSIFGMYLARERRGSWSSSTLEHHTQPQPFYGPFPGPPGWAGARRGLLDFMEQRKISRGRHTDHPVGRHSIQTNQYPPPLEQDAEISLHDFLDFAWFKTFLNAIHKCLNYYSSLCLDSFLYVLCVLLYIAYMCRFVTWWGGPGGIEAYPQD